MTEKKYRTRAEYDALPGLILAALERNPKMSAIDLVKELGYKSSSIRKSLRNLLDGNRIHSIAARTHRGSLPIKLWSIGPAPEVHELATQPEVKHIDVRQIIRQHYPDRVAVRDPLVAALFGPASFVSPSTPCMHSPSVDSALTGSVDIARDSVSQEVA